MSFLEIGLVTSHWEIELNIIEVTVVNDTQITLDNVDRDLK